MLAHADGSAIGPSGLDVDQLAADLEYILVDKAKVGSDILHRIHNAMPRGGIMMYAEVYKWFTETSGLGLTQQAELLMNPKAASREEDIAEVIETWEERVNRLARHGAAYRLPEEFKKVALKAMLVGKIKDNYELWEADKLSFEELLKKVKEQARAKKLDRDVQKGKTGVALGANNSQWQPWRADHNDPNANPTASGGFSSESELNAYQARKGKGKGGP